jgi:ABC-type amino acid transport substrate-binding protein
VIDLRGVGRAITVVVLVASVQSACLPETTKPSPSPTPIATATASRPRFELSTYQYGLQTKGKIKVAVRDSGFPPMSSHTNTSGGKLEGFEPDLAREIAKAIWGPNDDPDSHIEWISVDDSTRVSALTSKQADVSIAAIAVTDETKKVVDLSDAYFRTGARLLVKKTNDQIKEIADVASGEQTVCAVSDSQAEKDLRTVTNDRAKILELQTLDFCMQALGSGAADAIAADEIALFGLAFKDPALKLVAKPFVDQRLGIGLKKNEGGDRQGFLDFVNGVLLKVVADRTWAKLYEKHITPLTGDRKQLPTD